MFNFSYITYIYFLNSFTNMLNVEAIVLHNRGNLEIVLSSIMVESSLIFYFILFFAIPFW